MKTGYKTTRIEQQKSRRRRAGRHVVQAIVQLALVGLLLACSPRPQPAPPTTQALISGLPSPSAALTLSLVPAVTAAAMTSSPPALAGTAPATAAQPAAADATPSTTGCPPPPGWVRYQILPGDTLFSLANAVGTTVEEILRGNCMDDDLLVAYDSLYLPSRPPTPIPARPGGQQATQDQDTPPGPKPTGECDVPYVCPTPGIGVALSLATGGGNRDPNFEPCKSHEADPWLDLDTNRRQPKFWIQVGEMFYIHACDFPAEIDSAVVTYLADPTKTFDARLYVTRPGSTHPDPELKLTNSQAVIEWSALPLPDRPVGDYHLVVMDKSGKQADFTFSVIYPDPNLVKPDGPPFILVDPSSGAPGDRFQVYYVWFPISPALPFRLYGKGGAIPGDPHELTLRASWDVPIYEPFPGGAFGYASTSLELPPQLQPGVYAVSTIDKSVYTYFWLKAR